MNILIVSRGIPTEKYKNYGVFEYDQAKALQRYGHNVIIVIIDLRSIIKWRKWGFNVSAQDSLTIYSISMPVGRLGKITQTVGCICLNRIYKKIFIKHGVPDIIHTHFPYIAYYPARLRKKYRVALVMTEHFSQIMKNEIKKSIYKTALYAYCRSDQVLAVSPVLKKAIYDKFNVDARIIPNIVDEKIFYYLSDPKSENINFLSVGSLNKNKRMDLAITAFSEAFKDCENVSLFIFGEGPEKHNLLDLINKLHVSSKVKIMGLQSRAKIASYLNQTHCFVLVSENETFGVAYIEALACGVPVIATKCGGPELFVDENNGLLISKNNKHELIKALIYFKNNYNTYNRSAISQRILRKYSSHAVAAELTKVYEEVLYQFDHKKDNI